MHGVVRHTASFSDRNEAMTLLETQLLDGVSVPIVRRVGNRGREL